jgi:serine/threonine protein kinase
VPILHPWPTLRVLLAEVSKALGGPAHLDPPRERLVRALRGATDRAYRCLEIALDGESFWVRLAPKEQRAFRDQLRGLLDATFENLPPGQAEEVRRLCLQELRAARAKGLLIAQGPDLHALGKGPGPLLGPADWHYLLEAEWRALDEAPRALHDQGFPNLARVLSLRLPGGPALLTAAVRHFFQLAVARDEELARGLAASQLEVLKQANEQGFAALGGLMDRHTDSLDEARGALTQLSGDVLDVKKEHAEVQARHAELFADVLRAVEQFRLEHSVVRPADSLPIRDDAERRLVRELVSRYRSLPEKEQAAFPDLLNGLAKLQVAAGDFEAAQRDFEQVARLTPADGPARAEAHYNSYLAALELYSWDLALAELKAAVALDPGRFAPFPVDRFEAVRILGSGGFGTSFLCEHRFLGGLVVVKVPWGERPAEGPGGAFAEGRSLRQFDDPAIVRVLDSGYVDPATPARPYLVMDYCDALSLEDHVRKYGPVPAEQFPGLARALACALCAVHERGLMHRDVKPANVLVSPEGGGWQVKLIDFDLAMPWGALQAPAEGGASPPARQGADSFASDTQRGGDIAGTMAYAAPEQMGLLPGATVGPYSDVYAFGRTCAYALFGTPDLTPGDWGKLDRPLGELLAACLEKQPARRPQDFREVLSRLPPRDRPGGGKEGPGPARAVQVAGDGELTLHVRYDRDNKVYRYQLQSGLLGFTEEFLSKRLHAGPEEMVNPLVEVLDALARGRTKYSPGQARDWLEGTGKHLWEELIPEPLNNRFWECRDGTTRMMIYSEGDPIPWELLYPQRPAGGGEEVGFLAEQFPVGRWIYNLPPPPRRLRLQDPVWVLPPEAPPDASGEVSALQGYLGQGVTVGDLEALLTSLKGARFDLLHFAGHHVHQPKHATSSYVPIGDKHFDQALVHKLGKGRFRARSPLVFMNVCRSDGMTPSFTGLAGWARAFLMAGAGAFLGSLWDIRDGSSARFARELYQALRGGNDLGGAVQAARKAIQGEGGDPTWLAYTLYGNPAATLG